MTKEMVRNLIWIGGLVLLVMGFLVFFLGTAGAGVNAGPWYVNGTTGSDSNDCLSPGNACGTVNGALGKASPGDTVHIAAGTYDEDININQGVTLLGAGAEQTILTNSSGNGLDIFDGNGNAILFEVIIEDLAIQDAAERGIYSLENVSLSNVIMKNNGQGALSNSGIITVTNSTLANNGGTGSGAAIINFGPSRATLVNVSVVRNQNDNSIVHAQNDAHMTLTNVTISENSGNGEAIVVTGSAYVTVTNSTIAGNESGGLVEYNDQLWLQNTVVAGNSPNCWSELISLGNNFESTNSCGFDQPGDTVNGDPQLGGLGNYGGELLTQSPLSGSPLIDAGRNDICPASDARGVTRPFDGDDNGSTLCDIGAVEYLIAGVDTVAIDAPAGGTVNTDITISAAVLPDTGTQPVTYTWTADEQTQVVHTGGITDSVTFNWDSTGMKTINVTADNGIDQNSDSVQIDIQMGVQALSGVSVSGPASGIAGGDVTFTASAAPANATQPITYTWVVDGQSNITNVGGLSDQITVNWADDGSYDVMVTADNGVSSVNDTVTFTATSWYVNGAAGSDSNDCESAGAACATIQGALNKAAENGVIHIAAGSYDESLSIEQGVTLHGAGSGQTILTNSAGTAVTVDDFIVNDSYLVEMHQLTVANAGAEGIINSNDLVLSNIIVENNGGRGIGSGGVLTMTDSMIRGNTDGSGAALFNTGTSTLTGVTISGNSGSSSVVHTQSGGETSLINVTVSGNQTGTAVLSTGGSMVTILNSTIVHNNVGFANYAGITVQNSIIAANNMNCFNLLTSLGHNIEDSNSCNLDQAGDLVNTDPLLASLGSYGGPTPTHNLLKNSPAIDAGSNSACPAVDQRGVARPFDGDGNGPAVCDIGAVEFTSGFQVFIPFINK